MKTSTRKVKATETVGIPDVTEEQAKKKAPAKVIVPVEVPSEGASIFVKLHNEFSSSGIDVVRYRRSLILLTKQYILEKEIEEDIRKRRLDTNELVKNAKNPLIKDLINVRAAIMNTLKACGLMPRFGTSSSCGEQSPASDFASLQ